MYQINTYINCILIKLEKDSIPLMAAGRVEPKAPVARVTIHPGLPSIEKFSRKLELPSAKTGKVLDILGLAACPACGGKEIYLSHWEFTRARAHIRFEGLTLAR